METNFDDEDSVYGEYDRMMNGSDSYTLMPPVDNHHLHTNGDYVKDGLYYHRNASAASANMSKGSPHGKLPPFAGRNMQIGHAQFPLSLT